MQIETREEVILVEVVVLREEVVVEGEDLCGVDGGDGEREIHAPLQFPSTRHSIGVEFTHFRITEPTESYIIVVLIKSNA